MTFRHVLSSKYAVDKVLYFINDSWFKKNSNLGKIEKSVNSEGDPH